MSQHLNQLREPLFDCLSKEELVAQKSHKLDDYLDFMVDIASLFDVNETEARIELKEVVRLEAMIAGVSTQLEANLAF